MKRVLFSLLAVTMFTVICPSCKKAKEALGVIVATWHVSGTTYTSTKITRISTNQVMADGANTMQVFFSSIPTVSGSYKIVNENRATSLAADEMAVEFNVGAVDVYVSDGTDNKTGTVTVNSDGNLTITVPVISVEHFAGAGSIGTTTADGTITE